jgi:DNA-directed RNA polymerase subunit RPC12/RpoP
MSRSKEVRCPTCSGNSTLRVHRNGFLQQSVLGHFGIYPWKCGACGSLFLYRSRGYRTRRIKPLADTCATDQNRNSLL